MRRIMLAVLLAVQRFCSNGQRGRGQPKPKSLTYKVGTYGAKVGVTKFNIVLKSRELCERARPGEILASPVCRCRRTSPIADAAFDHAEVPLAGFTAPVQLPTSGKLSEQAPVSAGAVRPAPAPTTWPVELLGDVRRRRARASGFVEVDMIDRNDAGAGRRSRARAAKCRSRQARLSVGSSAEPERSPGRRELQRGLGQVP